jgi:WD40 repeat protein
MIASKGAYDGRIIIWDALTGEEILSHQVNLERALFLQHISWSPTGEFVAANPYGEDIFLLDVATGEIAKTFPGHTFDKGHSWSPDGNLIATSGEDGKVKVWDVASGYEQFSLYSHPGGVSGITWSLDGSQIITSGSEGQIKVWNTIMAPMTTSGFSFPGMEVTGGGAWSPNGSLFARAYMNGTAIIWDTVTGEMIHQIEGLGFLSFVTDWHPDQGLLINPNLYVDDLHIYDGRSFELIKQIQTGHSDFMDWIVMFPRFSPDGTMIATSSWDTDSRILDVRTGELIQVLDDHQAGVFSVGWSPDSTKVATGGWDHTAKVWDVQTGDVLMDLYPPDFGYFVNMAVWSPEGDRIATSAGGVATIWDLTGEQDPIELIGHSADIQEMGWTPDGNYILTSSVDGTGRLWDTETGIEISIYDIGMLSDGFLSPDGAKVAFSAVDGTVRFYPVLPEVDELIDYAYECCVVRELTEQERLMFGLDEID